MGNADFFGHVASTTSLRGMFGVFYDLSPHNGLPTGDQTESKDHILVTIVSGDAVIQYQQMGDSQIVELCLNTLRSMFPDEAIPQPVGAAISRWGADPYAQMSYSYVAVGSSGEDYDVLAEDVEGKIHFAGEVSISEDKEGRGRDACSPDHTVGCLLDFWLSYSIAPLCWNSKHNTAMATMCMNVRAIVGLSVFGGY